MKNESYTIMIPLDDFNEMKDTISELEEDKSRLIQEDLTQYKLLNDLFKYIGNRLTDEGDLQRFNDYLENNGHRRLSGSLADWKTNLKGE